MLQVHVRKGGMHMKHEEITVLNQLDRVHRVMRRGKGTLRRGSWRILRTIQKHPHMTTKSLADVLDIRVSSLNERVSRLIEKAWVKRIRNPKDQRTYLLEITDLGILELEGMRREREQHRARVESILSEEERESLIGLLGKLADGLEDI